MGGRAQGQASNVGPSRVGGHSPSTIDSPLQSEIFLANKINKHMNLSSSLETGIRLRTNVSTCTTMNKFR